MKNLRTSLLAVAFATASLSSAAQVTYTFTGFNALGSQSGEYTNPISFQLTVPDFITADTVVLAAAMSSCSTAIDTCHGADFRIDAAAAGYTGTPGLQVVSFGTGSPAGWSHHYFSAPAFTTPGTYATYFSFNPATLTVTAVPEPATWGLMLGGLGALGFALRRRPTATGRD